jgi:hypothetical protein
VFNFPVHRFSKQIYSNLRSKWIDTRRSTSLFFNYVWWVRVRLSSLGTLVNNWPLVPAPDEYIALGRMGISRGNRYSEKTCHNATLSKTNPAWPDLGLNPDRAWNMTRSHVLVLHVKCLLLSYFYLKLRRVDKIKQNSPVWNFINVRSVIRELLHADRRTDSSVEASREVLHHPNL